MKLEINIPTMLAIVAVSISLGYIFSDQTYILEEYEGECVMWKDLTT